MEWNNVLAILLLNIVVCSAYSLADNVAGVSQQNNNSQLTLATNDGIPAYETPVIVQLKHRRFIPFALPSTRDDPDNLTDTCSSSADDFPSFFTEEQRKNGAVALCFVVGIYCFTLLAIVCDRYFLPCVETICDVLHLTPDVAAATFMSVATSCPELFTNIIGTFVTESDIGIGTIVGSSIWNALGVAAIGGLAASSPLQLDWWPLTRDVCIYIMAVSLLVVITWDEYIYWYEALVLFIIYFVYFIVMFQNTRISNFVKGHFEKNKVQDLEKEREEPKAESRVSVISAYGTYLEEAHKPGYDKAHEKVILELDAKDKKEAQKSLFRTPGGSIWKRIFFYYSWPIQFCLRYTVPNPKVTPKLFPVTFVMCILWIGTNSYMVSWMVAVVGSVFNIPDAVLGLSFLAAGSGLPEAISMTIISRRGEGAFGVSNSLGANTMNILLSLGMPWFFKTISQGASDSSFIKIQSGSIEYTILALIGVACVLYITLFLNKFRLGKVAGSILITAYLICVILAILTEMVFFNNTVCIS